MLREQIPSVKGRSPLYERLLAGLAGATERGFDGGVIPRLLDAAGTTPHEARLLLLAALNHAAVIDPSLPHAAWFPTARDEQALPPDEGAPAALALAYLIESEERVAAFVREQRVQTNEVGRCTALLPGFLRAAGFGLPLRLLEVGCAAGLNLRFDRYHYRYANGPSWGPSGGPELEARGEGEVPRTLTPPTLDVVERHGVDLSPIDPTTDEGLYLLHSFVWPGETVRHERLHGAVAVARTVSARVDRGDLLVWSNEHASPREGVVTVLYHSQVRYQLDDAAIAQLDAVVDRACRAATPEAPMLYLALEPPRGAPSDALPELEVTVGDGSGPPSRSVLLTTDWHGRWVRWW